MVLYVLPMPTGKPASEIADAKLAALEAEKEAAARRAVEKAAAEKAAAEKLAAEAAAEKAPIARKSFWELFPAWLQAITVAAVAVFGYYQFKKLNIDWPAAAPVNLTMELNVKRAGVRFETSRELLGDSKLLSFWSPQKTPPQEICTYSITFM
jgi:hypothetical protein